MPQAQTSASAATLLQLSSATLSELVDSLAAISSPTVLDLCGLTFGGPVPTGNLYINSNSITLQNGRLRLPDGCQVGACGGC